MKNQKLKMIAAIVSSIVLIFLGLFFSEQFIDFNLRQFDGVNVTFVSTSMTGQSSDSFLFPASIGLLPFLFLFSSYLLQNENSWKIAFTIIITLLCGYCLMFLHVHALKVEMLNYPKMSRNIMNSFSISNIHAGRYLGIGFFLGSIIPAGVFYFTSKKRKYKSA